MAKAMLKLTNNTVYLTIPSSRLVYYDSKPTSTGGYMADVVYARVDTSNDMLSMKINDIRVFLVDYFNGKQNPTISVRFKTEIRDDVRAQILANWNDSSDDEEAKESEESKEESSDDSLDLSTSSDDDFD